MPQIRGSRALLISLLLGSMQAFAEPPRANIAELSWTDKQFMTAQLALVDELVRAELGAQIHGTENDLAVLQRVVSRNLVNREDTQTQQALGLVLGNVIANQTGMQWVAYSDEAGRSRALCVAGSDSCLFPMTMLSRRMAVGLYPDVNKLYREAMEMVAPLVSKSPYDVSSDS
jgi:hypothetical protein